MNLIQRKKTDSIKTKKAFVVFNDDNLYSINRKRTL